jgi:hypothetical protein
MRNHYDMQRELIEAALGLLGDVERHDDTFGLEAFRRQLADSGHRFSNGDRAYFAEFVERAAKFQSLKARCDKANDGEVDDTEMNTEKDWLLAQREILNGRFGHLLQ